MSELNLALCNTPQRVTLLLQSPALLDTPFINLYTSASEIKYCSSLSGVGNILCF